MRRSTRWLVGSVVVLVVPILLAACPRGRLMAARMVERPRQAPPERQAQPVLGVLPRSVPDGVQILDVVPGSAADKAGLKAGDVIVSVDGYNVGFVGGREYPLHSELRRIKDVGKFTIRERASGKTVSKDIRLEKPSKGDIPPPKEIKDKDKKDKEKDKEGSTLDL